MKALNCWCGSGLSIWPCQISWRRSYHNSATVVDGAALNEKLKVFTTSACPACQQDLSGHQVAVNGLGEPHLICKTAVAS